MVKGHGGRCAGATSATGARRKRDRRTWGDARAAGGVEGMEGERGTAHGGREHG